MFSIVINGQVTQLGQTLPSEITSLVVSIPKGLATPSKDTPLIRAWLKDLKAKLVCEYIILNGTIIFTEDI